jgi:3-hydroxypropionyl-CoA synthetase (ADP-forming)
MYRQYGFVPPRQRVVTSIEEAVRAAQEIGFPVALKIQSPDVIHKTDVGGVILSVVGPEEVEHGYRRIISAMEARCPEARIEGVVVQEMYDQGIELIIGLNADPQFGPTLMFGLGGMFTEALGAVGFRVLPISRRDAAEMMWEIPGAEILRGYRGAVSVDEEALIDLLVRAGKMGEDLAGRLGSIDFNPIRVNGSEHRVLDVKMLLRPERALSSANVPRTENLERFFGARSVAVVGASSTPTKIGYEVLDSLANHEYKGRVYPINPNRAEIMGLKAYPSLIDLPEAVDLVVVTVALATVPEILDQCGARGVHNLVIISGGGKELGGESQALERRIRELALDRDVRIVGCNCIGVFDGKTRLDTFFQGYERLVRPPLGPVALIVQSGTVGAALLEDLQIPGVSKFVSYGNKIDVDEADMLTYLKDDHTTHVMGCYIEGLEDGRKFLNAAHDAASAKPVVVFKPGRSVEAASASTSHTGTFGGTYRVYEGAFRQAGLIPVSSYEEFRAALRALAMQPPASGPRVAMISNGAGTMVQAIDLFKEMGLSMEPLSSESLSALDAAYPSYFVVQNPIDVTGSATSEHYRVGIEALMRDPNVDIVCPWFVFQDSPLDEGIVDVLAEMAEKYHKPLLCGATGGPYTQRMSRRIEERGIPVFPSVREWMAAAAASHRWRRSSRRESD